MRVSDRVSVIQLTTGTDDDTAPTQDEKPSASGEQARSIITQNTNEKPCTSASADGEQARSINTQNTNKKPCAGAKGKPRAANK